MLALLLPSSPSPLDKILLFAGLFVVVLVVVMIGLRRTVKSFAKPFEEEARRIGPVRCNECRSEGLLFVCVRMRTIGRDLVPKPTGATLLCAKCHSPSWTPLSNR